MSTLLFDKVIVLDFDEWAIRQAARMLPCSTGLYDRNFTGKKEICNPSSDIFCKASCFRAYLFRKSVMYHCHTCTGPVPSAFWRWNKKQKEIARTTPVYSDKLILQLEGSCLGAYIANDPIIKETQ